MADEPGKLDISDEMIAERRGGSGKMPTDMPSWMAKSIVNIDKFSKWIGSIVCWILMPLIFAMTYEVLARKLFLAPTIWAYDISRFLYGALFMLGAGYALSRGVHISYILQVNVNFFPLFDYWKDNSFCFFGDIHINFTIKEYCAFPWCYYSYHYW